MSDQSSSSTPGGTPSWSREGFTAAVSLLGAGAGLNSWFPAFQALGIILIIAGLIVLVGSVWPLARSWATQHLSTRARRFAAIVAIIVLIAGGGYAASEPWRSEKPTSLPANSLQVSAATPQSSLFDFLPDERELGVDLVEHDSNKRTGQALARLRSSDADELEQRLIEWGFVENAFRLFGRAENATPTPNTMFLVEVSILRFETPAGAAGALAWFERDRSTLSGLPEKPVPQIGDESRAIAGDQKDPDGTTNYREASVYARQGSLVVRVTTQSKAGNPMPVSVAITRLVISKILA